MAEGLQPRMHDLAGIEYGGCVRRWAILLDRRDAFVHSHTMLLGGQSEFRRLCGAVRMPRDHGAERFRSFEARTQTVFVEPMTYPCSGIAHTTGPLDIIQTGLSGKRARVELRVVESPFPECQFLARLR